jgi:hypothetical protein
MAILSLSLSLSLFVILEQVHSGSLTAACKQTHGAAPRIRFFKRINQLVKEQQISADLSGLLHHDVF